MSINVPNCSLCGKYFTSTKLLEEHQAQKHSKKFHSCDKCRKEFTSQDHLKFHREAHVQDMHCCKFCGELCIGQADIYKHLTTVHFKMGETTCGLCSKEFTTKVILKKHIKLVHMRKFPSMEENLKLFCNVHCPQVYFDHHELKQELDKINLSQVNSQIKGDDVSGGKFSYTGNIEKIAPGCGPENPECHDSVSNTAIETETLIAREQEQEVVATKSNSINPLHSNVERIPLSEIREEFPSALNNIPNSDWNCTIAGIEDPETFKNTFGIDEEIEKQETTLHSNVERSPLSEILEELPSALNNMPNSDLKCTSAGIEDPKTFKNTFGMDEEI